jgi:hypothetical protein
MKKLVLLSAIAVGMLGYNSANAQIGIHIGFRIFPRHIFVPQPEVVVQAPVYTDEAPADNYDGNDDYYYLPDENAYYSVPEQCYYYYDDDNWVSAAYLPGYQDFDWRSARRFEVHGPRPYLHNDFYMNRYHGDNRNWAHNGDNFRGGNDNHFNHDAYNAPQNDGSRGGYGQPQNFDNRGGNGQAYNRGDRNMQGAPAFNQPQNRGLQNYGAQRHDMNRDMSNKGGQEQNQNRGMANRGYQRVAQNNRGYDGHNNGRRIF